MSTSLSDCNSMLPPSPSSRVSVPLPLDEAAKGDQPDQGDDDPENQAPEDRDDDADDHEDSADADSANAAAATTIDRHSCLPSLVRTVVSGFPRLKLQRGNDRSDDAVAGRDGDRVVVQLDPRDHAA